MKQRIIFFVLANLFFLLVQAQSRFFHLNSQDHDKTGFTYGLKAGLNFSRLQGNLPVDFRGRPGYYFGLFADKSSRSFLGIRQEVSYCLQSFKTGTGTDKSKISLKYLYLTNLYTANLGNLLQLHAGPQIGFLVNGLGKDLASNNNVNAFNITHQLQRFTYGGCVGLEYYNGKGLLLGLRYNLNFTNSEYSAYNITNRFVSQYGNKVRLRNDLIQLGLGFRLVNL